MTKNELREAIRSVIIKKLKESSLSEATMWEPKPEIDEPDIDTDTEKEKPLVAPGAPSHDDEEYDEPFKAKKLKDIRRQILNRLKNKA
jgi:hypothetical protein